MTSEGGLPGLPALDQAIAAAEAANDPAGLLLAEHEWLRQVLDELQPLSLQAGRFSQLREDILELAPVLDTHIKLEEDAFFPAIEPIMRRLGRGSTEDMYGEHDAIRIRIDELLAVFHTTGDVATAYANFVRSLVVHFENEEELIFADAPQHLDVPTRQQILEMFRNLRQSS